jgi:chromosome segregation ATPase
MTIKPRRIVFVLLAGLLFAWPSVPLASAKPHHNKSKDTPPPADDTDQPAATQPDPNAVAEARANLNAVEARLKAAFESSPELTAAQANVDQARDALDTEKNRVVAGLADDPDYQAAVQQRKTAQAAIDQAHESTDVSQDQIADLAEQSMQAKTAVNKMESQAMADDSAATAAKSKLASATSDLATLREKFADSMKTNPDWIAARKKLDDAIAAASAASAQ